MSALILGLCIVVAAVLAPVAAIAAGQLVEISSASGRKAEVTRAEQLQAAEASPHQFIRGINYPGVGQCRTVLTAPAGKAVVVKAATISMYTTGTTARRVFLYIGAACSSAVVDVHAVGVAVEHLDFGAGLVVPAGQSLWAYAGDTNAVVSAFGYKVPSTAVPAGGAEAQVGPMPEREPAAAG